MSNRKVIFYLLAFAVFCIFVRACMGQVCVVYPRGDSAEAQAQRASVSRWLENKGHKVSCTQYEYELWYYPYGGSVSTGVTYFAAEFYTSENMVTGSYITNTPSVAVSGWMISLWPRGVWHTVYRDPKATSIEQGLKRVSKFLNKRKGVYK